jgi:uncharacterized alkaline shock family protein YloU
VDGGGADAPLPHWAIASSVVQVLYALQDSKIHGVVSMDCKAKEVTQALEDLNFRIGYEVVRDWKSLKALHI